MTAQLGRRAVVGFGLGVALGGRFAVNAAAEPTNAFHLDGAMPALGPAPRWSLNRRPVRNRQIRLSSGGKFPIDRHQRRCELPRGFLPRGFSDACNRASPHASDWQASENP
jgi:hypothetical protein